MDSEGAFVERAAVLAFVSLFFQIVSYLRRLSFAIGLRRSARASVPVISIGNISFGGTGKTPVVIALATALRERGVSVCILSRGYRRKKSQPTELVDPNGDAKQFGDEPLLIARRTKVPVVVDARRARAAQWASERLKPQVFLLDDGFSHLQLQRDFDLVLLAKDDLRPIARRRELRAALKDADAIASFEDVPGVMKLERRLTADVKGKRVIAMAAIAHPERFGDALRTLGAEVVSERYFHDHHAFPPGALEAAAQEGLVVITEKDAVKLEKLPERVIVAELSAVLPETFVRRILEAAHIIVSA